ncbi:MAG: hypothetical protein DMF74_15280 [Acidobacteria bacterium]|nr:MAG: hypothetical protein DMF74_15280 [Acidobacteriota bacterium]
MDTTGFSRVEFQLEPKVDRRKMITDTIGFSRMGFQFQPPTLFFEQNMPKLKLHAAEADGIQREFVTG